MFLFHNRFFSHDPFFLIFLSFSSSFLTYKLLSQTCSLFFIILDSFSHSFHTDFLVLPLSYTRALSHSFLSYTRSFHIYILTHDIQRSTAAFVPLNKHITNWFELTEARSSLYKSSFWVFSRNLLQFTLRIVSKWYGRMMIKF